MDTADITKGMTKVEPHHITPVIAIILAVINAKHLWRFFTVTMQTLSPTRRRKRNYVNQMHHLNRIQEKMAAIRHLDTVDRVVMFAGHNGGGLPRASSRYYTTALHWEVEEDFTKNVGEYKDIPVDYPYVKMLLQAEDENKSHFTTDSEEDCLLKRYYLVDGVVESVTYYLDIEDNNFIYLTVSTKSGFTDEDKMSIDLLCYATKTIVRESNK